MDEVNLVRRPGPGRFKNKGINSAAEQARRFAPEAIAVLVKQLTSKAEDIAQKAAIHLLDRGFGKPKEYIEVDMEPSEALAMALSETDRLLQTIAARRSQAIADMSAPNAHSAVTPKEETKV